MGVVFSLRRRPLVSGQAHLHSYQSSSDCTGWVIAYQGLSACYFSRVEGAQYQVSKYVGGGLLV